MAKTETTTWWAYVKRVAGTTNMSEIARRVGVDPATVGRWRQSEPLPASVVAFARAYNRDLLEAFTGAGWVPTDLLGRYPIDSLGDWTLGQLWTEVLARTDRSRREALARQLLDAGPDPTPGGDAPHLTELRDQTA